MNENEIPSRTRAFLDLISAPGLPSLGPGRRAGTRSPAELQARVKGFREAHDITGITAQLLHSAALLWHDHLEASHTLSQEIGTPDGSFLHGIMHRREPDFGNAKYWFHRVGDHPAFPHIARGTHKLIGVSNRDLGCALTPGERWEPFAFVDACKDARPPDVPLLEKIQQVEFQSLLSQVLG